MSYTLPDLNFDYDDFEPYIDAETMELHHKEHHASYLKKFNESIEDTDRKSGV